MSAASATKTDGLVRADAPCRLLVDPTPGAARTQSEMLRTFFRRALVRRHPGLPGIVDDDADHDPPAADVRAPVAAFESLFAFDVASLLRVQPGRAHALLAPLSVAEAVRAPWPGGLPDELDPGNLDRLAGLQQALRLARLVVAFSGSDQRMLAQLAGIGVQCVPLPAGSPPATPLRTDIVLLDQTGDAAALSAVRRAIEAVLPMATLVVADATGTGPGHAAIATEALPARIHVHVGLVRAALSAWRVVDSLAAGRSVVQVVPGPATALAKAERLQMSIDPMRTGFVAATAADAAEAVMRLIGDAAAAAAFRRSGERVVDELNRLVEDAIWEAGG